MQQQISVITLGIADLARSRRFYVEGFGWTPVFENPEIVFYQMNGLMLGTWLASSLAADSQRPPASGPGAFSLAHNVTTKEAVQPTLDRLAQFGGTILRPADAPPHWRLPRLRRRSRRPRLGDRLESGLADQPGRLRDVRHLRLPCPDFAFLPGEAGEVRVVGRTGHRPHRCCGP